MKIKLLIVAILTLAGVNLSILGDSDDCEICTLKLASGNPEPTLADFDQREEKKAEYTPVEKRKKIREIYIDELYKKVKNPPKNLILVNVLGERFHNDCHINLPSGSKALTINAPEKRIQEIAQKWIEDGWNKTKEIIVYCACIECDASYKAYNKLKELGFENVIAYEGGIREWWQTYHEKDPSVLAGPCAHPFLRQTGDSSKKIMALRDCALKQLLLEVHWGIRG